MSGPAPRDEDGGTNASNAAGDLSNRLDRLGHALQERHREDAAQAKARSGSVAGYAQAVKLSSEFIAGVLVGAAIGWLLDSWLETSPWGLIVFLLLGFVAGVMNVLRSAGVVADPGARKK